MERKEIESCLYNALQPDPELRKASEDRIMELQSKNYVFFIQNMVNIFTDPSVDTQLNLISGIILKNSLHSRDPSVQSFYEEKWSSIDENLKDAIKDKIIDIFSHKEEKIYILAGSILGHIARIEIPQNEYDYFFPRMERLLMDDRMAPAVFEAVGVCCNYLILETGISFTKFSNSVFHICLQKLEDKSGSHVIKEASLKCIMNSFEAMESMFERENNVLYLINCLAVTASIDEELANKSLICLNRFVHLFYSLTKSKIFDIINYVNSFWKTTSQDVLIQVLEFWTIICESQDVDVVNKYFDSVVPNVLACLKKDEDYIDQNWTPHKAAAICLEAINDVVREKILHNPIIFNFIDSELSSGNKARIDIGAVALGSVLSNDSEEQLVNFVKVLITNIRDPITEESCLWALSRVCETNFYAIVEHLPCLLSQTCDIIIKNQETATSAAWILNSIFVSIYQCQRREMLPPHLPFETQKNLISYATEQITRNYTYILQVLVNATENAKLEDSTLRVALFAALSEIIKIIDDSNMQILDDFIKYCIQKINECVVAVNKASSNYIPIIEDVVSNYVILSEVIAKQRKRNSTELLIEPYIDILKSKPTTAIGEVYIAMTQNIEGFVPFIDKFEFYIARDLSCLDEFILNSSLNLVGCLANHMQGNFYQLSTKFIPHLVQSLSSKEISKKLKPRILSVFGDIALSLGNSFEQYLDMSMMLFGQIINLERSSDEKYIDELRVNIIQMFDCIVLATSESCKLKDVVHKLIEGIKTLLSDSNSDETLLSLINLLQDLINIFGKNYDLDGPWVEAFFVKCMNSKNMTLRNKADKALRTSKK